MNSKAIKLPSYSGSRLLTRPQSASSAIKAVGVLIFIEFSNSFGPIHKKEETMMGIRGKKIIVKDIENKVFNCNFSFPLSVVFHRHDQPGS